MRVLDLFSGIGGFSLGLEKAGMQTVAFCESDPYCRAVLARHWPHVPIHHDVAELQGIDVGPIDVICGGFPCQDISIAGKNTGLQGKRSGLWREFARIIEEVRPRYVIVENVAVLRSRGLGSVLGDLAALGYDAEWHCIPASAIGAPHRRDRIWIVAYADRRGREKQWWTVSLYAAFAAIECAGWWAAEPGVGRVVHGLPFRVDRLRALGNAVVPQIPEILGRMILAHERHTGAAGAFDDAGLF